MHPSDGPHLVPASRPARRPMFVPVVIAAVFLAVIGASVGAVLGNRARADSRETVTGLPGETAAPFVSNPSAEPCRPETQRQAKAAGAVGVLRVALAIRTATSSAWICTDDGGRFFYHANRRNDQGLWIEGKTALFLTDVTSDGDAFRASTVDGQGRKTVFVVSPDSLVIIHKDGSEERQRVIGG